MYTKSENSETPVKKCYYFLYPLFKNTGRDVYIHIYLIYMYIVYCMYIY